MCRFIETVRIENGQIKLGLLHNLRITRVFEDFFPSNKPFSVTDVFRPGSVKQGRYKLRIEYGRKILLTEMSEYVRRTVNRVKAVRCDSIDYKYKYLDRSALNRLNSGTSDEAVVIIRNGFVTDSTFSNIALFDGSEWVTPDTWLLNGVMRQHLIAAGFLREKTVRLEDLSKYKTISFINAMLDLGELAVCMKSMVI